MQELERSRVERLLRSHHLRPDGPALIVPADGISITYAELARRAERLAAALRRLGLCRGDRVALWAEPTAELVVSLLAIYRSGAIAVPVNTRYRGAEARHVLEDSGAAAVVHDRPQALAEAEAEHLRVRIEVGPELDGLIDSRGSLDEPLPTDDDPALIIYTSGTTGPSKGALLSYRAIVDNIVALTDAWRWSQRDTLVLALPLFHVHGLCIGVHGALLHEMTTVLVARFSAEDVVQAFVEHGGTVFMGVPTMYARLIEHLERHADHSEVLRGARLFTAGSAALAPTQLERFEALTGHRILERYGMTETLITLTNPYDGERRPGSVGRPVPGCEIRVVDDEGKDAPFATPGELLVRSNGIMDGYWGLPDATRTAFSDGWFRTGDVVTRDDDGYVRIVGRKSVDIIKSGGFKIAAREIEDVLHGHPRVREVAVVGVSDLEWGERICAAVVLEDSARSFDAGNELAAFVAEHLADYKKPREILVLESLPRNALGKVEKLRLREYFERHED
jgi:acyl-CoA synthetase (AMP-forming)/AMP-acid ligase II